LSKRREILLGNEAIARGLVEAGCTMTTSYPGTPASEIVGTLAKWKRQGRIAMHVEWSINEKVAFEVALANSYAGRRSAVSMKQVGLNVASDPLMSAAYTGVAGGFLVVVADDPGPHSSQTEQRRGACPSRASSWQTAHNGEPSIRSLNNHAHPPADCKSDEPCGAVLSAGSCRFPASRRSSPNNRRAPETAGGSAPCIPRVHRVSPS